MHENLEQEQVMGFPGATIDGDEDSPKYVTLTSTGIKAEGAIYGGVFFDYNTAWESFNHYLQDYLKDKNKIYWRSKPECHGDSNTYFQDLSFERGVRTLEGIDVFMIRARLYAE